MSQISTTSTFAMSDFSQSGSFSSGTRVGSSSTNSYQPNSSKKIFKKSPFIPLVIVVVIIFAGAIFALSNVFDRSTTNPTQSIASNGKTVNIAKPLATQTINKAYEFPLKDANNKVVSKLSYVIKSAQIETQIVIKGQKATAVEGRAFLVIDLQITNSYDKSIQLNTRDYIRLIAGSSTEKLAADIHNDPVEVQAISTKYTRLGFPINTADANNLTLQIGEITGPKQTIKLNLQ